MDASIVDLLLWRHSKEMVMRRWQLLVLAGSTGLSGSGGCSTLQGVIKGCPDDQIGDSSIPTDRRAIEFLPRENQPVKSEEDP